MKLDELIKNLPSQQPPGSLKARVMKAVEEDLGARKGHVQANDYSWPAYRRIAGAMAAVAASVLLVLYLAPAQNPPAENRAAMVETEELDVFIAQTFSQIYDAYPGEVDNDEHEEQSPSEFIESNLNKIFWINGGNNA